LTQAVIDEVENDPAQLRGPDFIKDQLRLKNATGTSVSFMLDFL
jgi:hypothetical protein